MIPIIYKAGPRFLANKQEKFVSADGKTAIFGTYHQTGLPLNASRSANMVKCNYARFDDTYCPEPEPNGR